MSLLKFFRKKITVATHSGSFHADDVFAVAILKIWAEQNNRRLKVVRTRDPEIIEEADFVVDVGEKYDPEKNRFDHHQPGAPTRENGIPYAAIGLVWKHYGEKICGKEAAERVEKSLIFSLDAKDNGIAITSSNHPDIRDHVTSDVIFNFSPTWQEPESATFTNFKKAVGFAEEILRREIKKAEAEIEGNKITRETIEKQGHPEILVLDRYVSYTDEVAKDKNIKFVITPGTENDWTIKSGRDDPDNYVDRARMPENWWGLRDEKLEKASGIKNAYFCIKVGWYGKAKTKEAAIEMARKSL